MKSAAGKPAFSFVAPDKSAPIPGWTRVFIKPRLARGTQMQIPVSIVAELKSRIGLDPEKAFFEAIDRQTNKRLRISAAKARGSVNTYKMEVVKPKGEAVVKIEIVGSELIVERYDTSELAGAQIELFIREGLNFDPPLTNKTRSDIETATLYRYD